MSYSRLPGMIGSLPATASTASTALLTMADYIGVFTSDDDKSSYLETVSEEFDDRVVDGVQVTFYTRHADVSGSIGSVVAVNAKDEEHDDWDEHCRHWALVFYFPNTRRYITHEATVVDTKLVWMPSQMPPYKIPGSKVYSNIAKCRISPKQLEDLAKGIEINNMRYNAALRNCQEWIKLFAEAIGGEVREYVYDNFKSYFKNNPLRAGVLGVVHSCLQANKALINTLTKT